MTAQPCSLEWFSTPMLLVDRKFMDRGPDRDEKLERELRIRSRRVAEITGKRTCLDCTRRVETPEADRCRPCRKRHECPDG
jgi:hypothetical protein